MQIPSVCTSRSSSETEEAGRALAELLVRQPTLPTFIALYGDLGVGKTAFVRGFASVTAPTARVKSPTFALVNRYRGEERSVYHFDMYRIETEDELESIGFYDYLNGRDYCLVEWSENIPYALPARYLTVEIRKDSPTEPDSRSIAFGMVGQS